MSIELKPCPFCGGNDLAVESATPDWSVACLNPACPVKPDCWIGFSRKQAVEGWNTRALEAENAALNARLLAYDKAAVMAQALFDDAARGPALSEDECVHVEIAAMACGVMAKKVDQYKFQPEVFTDAAAFLCNLLERAKR